MSQAAGSRRQQLLDARQTLLNFNPNEFFELPGRPNVIYTIGDYSRCAHACGVLLHELSPLMTLQE